MLCRHSAVVVNERLFSTPFRGITRLFLRYYGLVRSYATVFRPYQNSCTCDVGARTATLTRYFLDQVYIHSPYLYLYLISQSQSTDIRTLYLLFILSFVDRDTVSSLKASFLEQRREIFMGIFKGLCQDPYIVIEKVLQVCWEGLWLDRKVKRTLKIGVFGETTISHVSSSFVSQAS